MADSPDISTIMSQLRPRLEAVEQLRLERYAIQQRRKWWAKRLRIILAIGLLGGMYMSLSTDVKEDAQPYAYMAFGCFVCLLGTIIWVMAAAGKYYEVYKQDIVARLAPLLGFSYEAEGRVAREVLQASRILPQHDIYDAEDYFEGMHNGAKIRFGEVCLKQRRETRDSKGRTKTEIVTVFRGLIILLELPHKRFTSHTILIKDMALNNWIQGMAGFKRINLVDPAFESTFDVFGTDQMESRYLIDPAVMERFMALHAERGDEGFSAAFFAKHMLLALPTYAELFEAPPLEQSILGESEVRRIINEIEIAKRFVDVLDV